MSMNIQTTITLSPEQVAEALWGLDSKQQAEMFSHLFKLSDGSHRLMMQFLDTYDWCKELRDKGDPDGLDAFQSMFACAFPKASEYLYS